MCSEPLAGFDLYVSINLDLAKSQVQGGFVCDFRHSRSSDPSGGPHSGVAVGIGKLKDESFHTECTRWLSAKLRVPSIWQFVFL